MVSTEIHARASATTCLGLCASLPRSRLLARLCEKRKMWVAKELIMVTKRGRDQAVGLRVRGRSVGTKNGIKSPDTSSSHRVQTLGLHPSPARRSKRSAKAGSITPSRTALSILSSTAQYLPQIFRKTQIVFVFHTVSPAGGFPIPCAYAMTSTDWRLRFSVSRDSCTSSP